MDEKTRTFVVQVVFSLGMMCFCIGMIASDKDKMLPIFLPLLTAQVGIWTPGPKMKKKKPEGGATPDPELGNMKEQVAAVTAHAAQQSNVINQLVQRAAASVTAPAPTQPNLQMPNQQ